MAKGLYSIYDKVAKEYGPLFPAKSNDVAIRAFRFDIPQEYKVNLKDFKLYKLGEFDELTGTIAPIVEEVNTEVEIE